MAKAQVEADAPTTVNSSVRKTRKYLTPAEVERLMAAARKSGRYGHRDAIMILCDNDRAYGQAFTRRLRTMGIRDRPTLPRSPWQNAYVERLIGTLRRECLDHVLIFGERHLRRILALYSSYYNQTRTHLALRSA